jgi:hypothetical protein
VTLLRELHQPLFVVTLFVALPASLALAIYHVRNYNQGRSDR